MKRLLFLPLALLAVSASAVEQALDPNAPVPARASEQEILQSWATRVCYVRMVAAFFAEDAQCARHDETRCARLAEQCRWNARKSRCHGARYARCLESVPKRCNNDVRTVEQFPRGLAPSHAQFYCNDRAPIEALPVTAENLK